MQARAAEDLRLLVTEGLKAQGLVAGEARAYATPRRLALVVEDVPAKSPDLSEERKGPRVNAPEQAIAGFVKFGGPYVDQGRHRRQGRQEGRLLRRQGREAGAGRPRRSFGDVVPAVAAKFPWPKSMRAGVAGRTTWVRPLHSNRVHARRQGRGRSPSRRSRPARRRAAIASTATCRSRYPGWADYTKALKAHKVILDPAERAP